MSNCNRVSKVKTTRDRKIIRLGIDKLFANFKLILRWSNNLVLNATFCIHALQEHILCCNFAAAAC